MSKICKYFAFNSNPNRYSDHNSGLNEEEEKVELTCQYCVELQTRVLNVNYYDSALTPHGVTKNVT